MLELALEPVFIWFSSINGYQFISQGILCLLPLLYIYHHVDCLKDIVVNILLYFYYNFYVDPKRSVCTFGMSAAE
jgi:hypothetical protein